MSEEPRIHRRQGPAPRAGEPPAVNQNVPDTPASDLRREVMAFSMGKYDDQVNALTLVRGMGQFDPR